MLRAADAAATRTTGSALWAAARTISSDLPFLIRLAA
jgi:hypothetical protein